MLNICDGCDDLECPDRDEGPETELDATAMDAMAYAVSRFLEDEDEDEDEAFILVDGMDLHAKTVIFLADKAMDLIHDAALDVNTYRDLWLRRLHARKGD